MSYSVLFEPKYLFEAPILEKYNKLKTNVTKKQISGGAGPSVKGYFVRFNLQGQILAFFEGTPKTETPPQHIISIRDITEIKEKTIDGEELIYIKLLSEEIGLKFEKNPERKEWLQAISEFQKTYSKGIVSSTMKEFKDELTPILEAKIQSDIEGSAFDTIKKHFEYGNFCRDKGFKGLLDLSPKILKNRLIIGQCKFDGKMIPAELVDKKRMSNKQKLPMPSVKNAPKPIADEALYGKNMHVLLVCQKPACFIDQTTILTDYEIMQADLLPQPLEFNYLYFYSYESTGDISPVKKSLHVM